MIFRVYVNLPEGICIEDFHSGQEAYYPLIIWDNPLNGDFLTRVINMYCGGSQVSVCFNTKLVIHDLDFWSNFHFRKPPCDYIILFQPTKMDKR